MALSSKRCSLRMRFDAFVAALVTKGIEPTIAMMVAAFPAADRKTLDNYLCLSRRRRGSPAYELARGMPCRTEVQQAEIGRRIAVVRAEKERAGPPPDRRETEYARPVVHVRLGFLAREGRDPC